jgi:hypothetical protein
MKTVDGKNTYLWKRDKNRGLFTRTYPLGNNNEYFEISNDSNITPIDKVTVMKNSNDTQELPETSQVEAEAASVETPVSLPESDVQQAKTLTDLIPAVMSLDSRQSPSSARNHLENYAKLTKEGKLTKGHKAYLINLLNRAGIQVTMENVEKVFKMFC